MVITRYLPTRGSKSQYRCVSNIHLFYINKTSGVKKGNCHYNGRGAKCGLACVAVLVSVIGARKNRVREGYLLAPATQAKCGRGWRAMCYFFCHPLR